MKQRIIYFICFFIVLMLSSTSFASSPKTTITVLEDYRQKEAATSLINRLKDYPSEDVNVSPFYMSHHYVTTNFIHAFLRTLLIKSHDIPDVFFVDTIYLADFYKSGYLLPLDSYMTKKEKEAYLDYALKPGIIEGKLIAVPVHYAVGVIYYRKDLLEEAGIAPPKTWDEIKQAIIKIQKQHPDLMGYIGQFNDYEGLVCNFLEIAWSNGADPFNITEENTPNLIEAIQILIDWIHKDGIMPKSVLKMTEDESFTLFQNKKAVFMRNWPSTKRKWIREGGLTGKIGLMPWPVGPSGKESYMVSGGWYYVVNSNTKHKKEAVSVLKFLNNSSSQTMNFNIRRQIPTRKEMFKLVAKDFPEYQDYIDKKEFKVRNRPPIPHYSELSHIISSSVHKALIKELSPAEAVKRMKTEIEIVNKKLEQKMF